MSATAGRRTKLEGSPAPSLARAGATTLDGPAAQSGDDRLASSAHQLWNCSIGIERCADACARHDLLAELAASDAWRAVVGWRQRSGLAPAARVALVASPDGCPRFRVASESTPLLTRLIVIGGSTAFFAHPFASESEWADALQFVPRAADGARARLGDDPLTLSPQAWERSIAVFGPSTADCVFEYDGALYENKIGVPLEFEGRLYPNWASELARAADVAAILEELRARAHPAAAASVVLRELAPPADVFDALAARAASRMRHFGEMAYPPIQVAKALARSMLCYAVFHETLRYVSWASPRGGEGHVSVAVVDEDADGVLVRVKRATLPFDNLTATNLSASYQGAEVRMVRFGRATCFLDPALFWNGEALAHTLSLLVVPRTDTAFDLGGETVEAGGGEPLIFQFGGNRTYCKRGPAVTTGRANAQTAQMLRSTTGQILRSSDLRGTSALVNAWPKLWTPGASRTKTLLYRHNWDMEAGGSVRWERWTPSLDDLDWPESGHAFVRVSVDKAQIERLGATWSVCAPVSAPSIDPRVATLLASKAPDANGMLTLEPREWASAADAVQAHHVFRAADGRCYRPDPYSTFATPALRELVGAQLRQSGSSNGRYANIYTRIDAGGEPWCLRPAVGSAMARQLVAEAEAGENARALSLSSVYGRGRVVVPAVLANDGGRAVLHAQFRGALNCPDRSALRGSPDADWARVECAVLAMLSPRVPAFDGAFSWSGAQHILSTRFFNGGVPVFRTEVGERWRDSMLRLTLEKLCWVIGEADRAGWQPVVDAFDGKASALWDFGLRRVAEARLLYQRRRDIDARADACINAYLLAASKTS